jgi:hypothetical protein
MKRAILLMGVALIIALGGCSSKRESRQETAPTQETPSQEPERTSGERKITLTPTNDQPAQKPETLRVVTESRPVMQRDQILSLRGGGVYSPEDYEIGELQRYSDDKNVRAILERIRSFVNGLEAAEVPLEDVHPDWKMQAQRSLLFHLERGNIPTGVRVGAIEIYAPDSARANIRLTGDPGIALGEIYIKKFEDLWLVNDIQIDMENLSEEPVQRQEPYEPSIYRMTDMP